MRKLWKKRATGAVLEFLEDTSVGQRLSAGVVRGGGGRRRGVGGGGGRPGAALGYSGSGISGGEEEFVVR